MTKHNTLKCPHCNHELDIDKVVFAQIEGQLQTEYVAKQKKLEDELAQKSEAVIKQQKELEQKQKDFDTQIAEKVASQLSEEKKKLLETAKKEAKDELGLELEYAKTQAEEAKKKTEEANKKELEQRKKLEELEEYKRNQELEIQRRLDTERKKERANAEEEFKLKLAEKDQQLKLTQQSLEEARKRAEQGSMQIQGEVQEMGLKESLQRAYPIDLIDDVATGARGADLIQTVNNNIGQKGGIILWESKNTKEWSNTWIDKLKENQKIVNADMCILITQAMPKDVTNFHNIEGVWVSEPKYAIPLANILREQLLAIKESKQALVGQGTKMEILYKYLLSTEFKNHIESVVDAFSTMQDDLQKEKRAMQKIWKAREKQIEIARDSSIAIHGDLKGIIGKALPDIEKLELDAGSKKPLKGDDDE